MQSTKYGKDDEGQGTFFQLPCYPRADQCFVLSKESIARHMHKTPLDRIVALGSFFVEQKRSLAKHVRNNDPTIRELYGLARRIFDNRIMTEDSETSRLLQVIEDAETRYGTAIGMLEDEGADPDARKRTADFLKERMALLQTCKRQHIASRSALPTSSPNSSAQDARNSSEEHSGDQKDMT